MKYWNPFWNWLGRNYKFIVIGVVFAYLYSICFWGIWSWTSFYIKHLKGSIFNYHYLIEMILLFTVLIIAGISGFIIRKRVGWLLVSTPFYFDITRALFGKLNYHKMNADLLIFLGLTWLFVVIATIFINQEDFRRVFKIEPDKKLYLENIISFILMSLVQYFMF